MSKKIELYKPEVCEWAPDYNSDGKAFCQNNCGLTFSMHAQPREIELRNKLNEIINKLNER